MSDLISRKALIRDISKVCGDLGIELPDQVIDIITAQPTAYNVDAVVAELEQKKEIVKEYEKFHCAVRLDEAIDIVRKGGVE